VPGGPLIQNNSMRSNNHYVPYEERGRKKKKKRKRGKTPSLTMVFCSYRRLGGKRNRGKGEKGKKSLAVLFLLSVSFPLPDK